MIKKKKKKFPLITNDQVIDYKNIRLLSLFLTKQGKIVPRYKSGIKVQQQKKLSKAIKQARMIASLPFLKSNIK